MPVIRGETVEEQLLRIQEQLSGWEQFVREVRVPAELAIALGTGRPELLVGQFQLLKAIPPRDLPAAEAAVLYDCIGVLLETNRALQRHAQLISRLANQQLSCVKGLLDGLYRLEAFADFRATDTDDVEEEAAAA